MNELKTQEQAQYAAPQLVEMGSVNELTETGGATNGDGASLS